MPFLSTPEYKKNEQKNEKKKRKKSSKTAYGKKTRLWLTDSIILECYQLAKPKTWNTLDC